MTLSSHAAAAQDPQDSGSQSGLTIPSSDKLKIQFDLLLGWSYDCGNEKNGVEVRVGLMRMPLGFGWEDAGSMSAKDAPRIQRINAETSIGPMLTYRLRAADRNVPLLSASIAYVLGEGNRWWDYDYFLFENG